MTCPRWSITCSHESGSGIPGVTCGPESISVPAGACSSKSVRNSRPPYKRWGLNRGKPTDGSKKTQGNTPAIGLR